jgi:crotonobetainyl-CoA:carnitine CoA-transferase CaiB-like acyl-CoA transferase
MLADVAHAQLGPVRVVAPPVKLDGDGFRAAPVTPPFGSEVRAILHDLGFTDAEVETFIRNGATREQLT